MNSKGFFILLALCCGVYRVADADWSHKIGKLLLRTMAQSQERFFEGEPKAVALTFDDGPDNVITPAILDVLHDYQIKGTFFFIGERIEKFPEVVMRAHQEGHAVANHSWSHPRFSILSDDEIKEEIEKTERALIAIRGEAPLIMRPPYGDVNGHVMRLLKKMNYKVAFWQIDTRDWETGKTVEDIVRTASSKVKAWDIILMHSNENKQRTLEALPSIIERLKRQGFSFSRLQ